MAHKVATLVDLASKYHDVFTKVPEYASVPFYGEAYNLTYGQYPSSHWRISEKIDVLQTKTHLEMFAGNAFESYLLAEEFPEKLFFAADNQSYFEQYKLPNLHYVQRDCIKGPANGQYDFLFVGGANESLNSVLTIKDLWAHFTFANKSLVTNGYYMASYTERRKVDKVTEDTVQYQQSSIEFGKYKGSMCYWFMYAQYHAISGIEEMQSLVVLTGPFDRVIKAMVTGVGQVKHHALDVIIEVAQDRGFKFLPDKSSSYFGEYLLFQKL